MTRLVRPATAVARVLRDAVARRSVLFGLVIGLPASVLFLYLAARNVDAKAAATAVRGADSHYVALALVAIACFYVLQAARWRWIARRDASLPTHRFLKLVLGAIACNNVVPGRPGDFLRGYWLARAAGGSQIRMLGTVITDRASDVLALLILLAAGIAVVGHRTGWLLRLEVAAGLMGLVLVVGLVGVRWRARRAAEPTSAIGRLVGDVVGGIAQTLNRVDAVIVGAVSIAAWCTWGLGAWAAAAALGIPLSPLEIAFVTAVVNLGVAVPSSPGFVGTYQWLCVAALGLLAVDREGAFAFSVLMHAVWFVPTTLAGGVLLLAKGTGVRMPRVEPETEASAA